MKPLTQREKTCLQWAAVGKTSWEMGVILGLTERTVNFHIHNACRKLGSFSLEGIDQQVLPEGVTVNIAPAAEDTEVAGLQMNGDDITFAQWQAAIQSLVQQEDGLVGVGGPSLTTFRGQPAT